MGDGKLTEVKFNLYTLLFKPYADFRDEHDSISITKEVAKHLSQIRVQGKAILYDRNENLKGKLSREIFISGAAFIPKDRRIQCTMALIRKGKRPKLLKKGTFDLKNIKDLGDIVETTHFFIDFKHENNVICVEQNHYGPNIGDIQFYLQKIARDELQICRSSDLIVHMNNNIRNTLEKLANVTSFNIKIRPTNIKNLNKEFKERYFTGFDIVSKVYQPEFIKIEAFFKKAGRKVSLNRENKKATGMFRNALQIFNKTPEEIDYYDNFVVKYEDTKGAEQNFNLLTEKKVFVKKVLLQELTLKDSYGLISDDLTEFAKSIKDENY